MVITGAFQEVETATDVMFRDGDSLARLYPSLLEHALLVPLGHQVV